MQLKSGIKIYSQNLDDILKINSGTIHHSHQSPNEIIFKDLKFIQKYEPEAHLPKRDWRSPNKEEIKLINGENQNKKDYNSVFTGEIPLKIQNIFDELDLHSAHSEVDLLEKFRNNSDSVGKLNSELNDFLENISLVPFRFMSLATNYPNSEIVSLDKRKLPANYTVEDLQYIGIHKDSSEKMTLHSAHKCGNRLTINLGQQSRYLLFMNLSMIQAYNMIKEKIDVKENNVNNKNITSFFLKLFPDYPMLRVEQKPYHYYIAPTDNCFHDGSTLGNTSLDIVITYLGKFVI
ncbi:hypothetical protein [Chryseobacterium sp. SIMBA_038]|uniref:hypothetical protein n=1 Tax=Chryseobacterium sp. SIMBA_038 TaxID=3085780 RepID=UPI0039781D69